MAERREWTLRYDRVGADPRAWWVVTPGGTYVARMSDDLSDPGNVGRAMVKLINRGVRAAAEETRP